MDNLPGLKRKDIQPCIHCGKGIMHDNNIHFYRVTVQSFIVDVTAIQRAHGLEMMLGGHAQIAVAMGPDEDLAKAPCLANTVLICQPCALGQDGIGALLSAIQQKDNDSCITL